MGTRASEAARVVNTLLAFTGDDQQGLLEVMEDYFTCQTIRIVMMILMMTRMTVM